jgi:adenosylcobinamide-GDP ribazoletransferase
MDAAGDRADARLTAPARELSAAVALLSRVPLHAADRAGTAGAAAFGVVGAALGAIASVVLVVALPAGPLVAAVLAVATLAVTTGALHLDGLGDTADALAAPNPARAEEARHDPRAGAAAVVAIVVAIVLDTALIARLVEHDMALAAASVVVATAVSRSIATVIPRIAGTRVRDGVGEWFARSTSTADAALAIATAIALALVAAALVNSPELAFGAVVGSFAAILAAEWIVRRRGGLDGDAIGATVEVAFAAVLLATLAIGQIV